jgi:ribonuclease-3
MTDKKSAAVAVFQDRLGYHFQDTSRLEIALTHASTGDENYERMEFLGDRVLGLVIADILYKTFPTEKEGTLARRLSALACTETLAKIALTIDLPDVVRASESERASGGVTQENLLADCMEAIIGAVFLDRGYQSCHDLIAGLWGEKIFTLAQPPLDPKTGLQEWVQARHLPVPVYEVVGREGPDHAPIFHIRATVEGYDPAEAKGPSRRAAEKDAAKALLDQLTGKKS